MLYFLTSFGLIGIGGLGVIIHRSAVFKIQSIFLIIAGISIAYFRLGSQFRPLRQLALFAAIVAFVYLLLFLAAIIIIHFLKSANNQTESTLE
ncbi:MAG TPA: hypothetical protein ENN20_09820 [Candidatus Marinimicrobia bacterium]|nr:hypothetical protein [Candidatus Neomarinimicrobiota bacterium]